MEGYIVWLWLRIYILVSLVSVFFWKKGLLMCLSVLSQNDYYILYCCCGSPLFYVTDLLHFTPTRLPNDWYLPHS